MTNPGLSPQTKYDVNMAWFTCNPCKDRGSNEVWCEHIQEQVQSRNDWTIIFKDADPRGDRELMVPIIPSLDVWQLVLVGPEVAEYMRPVYLASDRFAHVRIGTICKGEGMLVMRSLIWEYASAQEMPRRCQGKLHEYKFDKGIAAFNKTQQDAHRFTMTVDARCLYCNMMSFKAAHTDYTNDVPVV